MKNKQNISPIGLKGREIHERQLALMGMSPINENVNKGNSVVELTKIGPDGNAYAIVRENHEYYIKRTNKTTGLVLEDFKYIGGLQNKKSEAYPSYARAIKQLNLKFKSLAEAFNKGGDINVFEDDNLLTEAGVAGFSQMSGNGFTGEGNLDENEEMYKEEMVDEFDKPAMQNFIDQYGEEKGKQIYYATANKEDRNPETFKKEEELNEFEQAIEEMMARMEGEEEIPPYTGEEDYMQNQVTEKEFPDLTGDGKVTRADILKGRGVELDENDLEGIDHEAYDLVEFLKSKLVERGVEVTPENISMVSLAYPGGTITDLEKISSILSQTNEELHGGQHNLDVDDDGEIESSDLAALRAMEESIAKLDNMITSLTEGTVKKKVVTKK
jgi:hypothetical protein